MNGILPKTKKAIAGFNTIYVTEPLFNASFYGFKSLFILYVIGQYSLPESEAVSLYAILMALCYASSLIGGYIADRGLGIKKSILLGGTLSVIGLLTVLQANIDLLFLGLAITSLGSGFFKPSILAAIGLIYADSKDPKKDRTYSIIYVLDNLGIFSIPPLCGFIGKIYGLSFGIMFVVGLFFVTTILVYKTMRFHPSYKHQEDADPQDKLWLVIPSLIGILYLLFKFRDAFHGLMGLIAVLSVLYLGKIAYNSQGQERKNIFSIFGYILVFALFCTLFEQSGSSLLLFFDKAVNREFFGLTLPASTLISLNPLFILLCSPLTLFFSSRYLERRKTLDGFIKVGIGFIFVSLSFAILALSTFQPADHSIPIIWILLAIFCQMIGELLVVPITLSRISQYAPQNLKSIMMSYWTLAIAYGHYFAGAIAQFSLKTSQQSYVSFEHYRTFFTALALSALGISLCIILYRILKVRSLRV